MASRRIRLPRGVRSVRSYWRPWRFFHREPDPLAGLPAGAWTVLTPADSTLFTDAARTAPAVPGAAVGGFADSGGAGHHWQATGTARPTRAAGAGGFVTFDGVNDLLTATPGPVGVEPGHTLVVAVRLRNFTRSYPMIAVMAAAGVELRGADTSAVIQYLPGPGVPANAAGAAPSDTWIVVTGRADAGGVTTVVVDGVSGSASVADPYTLGSAAAAVAGRPDGSFPCEMDLAFLAFYTRPLTAGELTDATTVAARFIP